LLLDNRYIQNNYIYTQNGETLAYIKGKYIYEYSSNDLLFYIKDKYIHNHSNNDCEYWIDNFKWIHKM